MILVENLNGNYSYVIFQYKNKQHTVPHLEELLTITFQGGKKHPIRKVLNQENVEVVRILLTERWQFTWK